MLSYIVLAFCSISPKQEIVFSPEYFLHIYLSKLTFKNHILKKNIFSTHMCIYLYILYPRHIPKINRQYIYNKNSVSVVDTICVLH